MGDTINIGGLCAAPGQRVHGFISIGDGEFSLPATIVRGEKPGRRICGNPERNRAWKRPEN